MYEEKLRWVSLFICSVCLLIDVFVGPFWLVIFSAMCLCLVSVMIVLGEVEP
jgi:hypothetical protein